MFGLYLVSFHSLSSPACLCISSTFASLPRALASTHMCVLLYTPGFIYLSMLLNGKYLHFYTQGVVDVVIYAVLLTFYAAFLLCTLILKQNTRYLHEGRWILTHSTHLQSIWCKHVFFFKVSIIIHLYSNWSRFSLKMREEKKSLH